MKMLKVIVTLLLVNYCISAVTADCKFNGKTYKTGEKAMSTVKCMEATCLDDGSMGGSGCAMVQLSDEMKAKNCVISKEDMSKPFPDCCPQPECP